MRVPPLGEWAGYQLVSEEGLAVPGLPVRLGGGSVLSRRKWVHLNAAPTIFSSGVVNVVHGDGDLVEHSAGTDAFYRGSPLFDDKFGVLVGLANDRDVRSISDFRSIGRVLSAGF
jgi:hypothetical protein